MFKLTAVGLDASQHRCSRDWHVCSKMPGWCLIVAAASVIREMRSFSEWTSHRNLQQALDWMGRANRLACQVSGCYTSGLLPVRPHWISDLHVVNWFWRGSYCPCCWGSSKHRAAIWHFRVHTSVSVVLLSTVYPGWWPYIWTSLIWYEVRLFFFFFRILHWFCLISNLSQM